MSAQSLQERGAGVEGAISRQLQQQVQQQLHVLDNLRYEGETLTDKLMKLRSSRQDIEAELFSLKDKRIRLLEVINKLEDEEMQLVSEVNSIIAFKRTVLAELPWFEARARASAGLAVVQDYLLASVHHLQHLSGPGEAADAASLARAAAEPSWSGTAQPSRPSATWDMRYLPAAALPSRTVSTQTGEAAAQEGLQLGVQQQQEQEQEQEQPTPSALAGAPPPPPPPPKEHTLSSQYSVNPFAQMTLGQLLQLQQQEGSSSAEGLPPLPEDRALTSAALTGAGSSRAEHMPRRSLDYQLSSMSEPQQHLRSRGVSRDQGSFSSGWTSVSSGTSRAGSSFTSGRQSLLSAASAGGTAAGPGARKATPGAQQRLSLDEGSFTSGAPRRQPSARAASATQQPPPPPPPPPHRTKSVTLPLVEGQEQEQQRQQHQQQVMQQQLQQQRQHEFQDTQRQLLLQQQQQQQLLQVQQQQQILLQQLEQRGALQGPAGVPAGGLAAAVAAGYDPSSAGTLDVMSLPSSSIAGFSTGSLPAAGTGSLPSAALQAVAPQAGSNESLWMLPAGTLILQGEGGSSDLSQQVHRGQLATMLQQVQQATGEAAAELGQLSTPALDIRRLTLDEAFELARAGGEAAAAAVQGTSPAPTGSRSSSSSHHMLGLTISPAGSSTAGSQRLGGSGLSPAAAGAGAAPLVVLTARDGSGQIPGGFYAHQPSPGQGRGR